MAFSDEFAGANWAKQGLPIMDCKLSMNQQCKVAANKKIQFQSASIGA